MNTVKSAVIGAGFFGGLHARVLKNYHRSQLCIVCDKNIDQAKLLASQLDCDYTDSIDEITDNDQIDLVTIATPDHAHRDPALRVLRAKKHMFIEKPLTTVVDESLEIIEAASKVLVKTMVDFTNRWNPPFVEAKEQLNQDVIGKPIMAYARLNLPISSPLDMYPAWCSKSGPEWYLFPHSVDMVRWLIEEDPTSVYAVGVKKILKRKNLDSFDAIQAQAMFGDIPVALETSWVMARKNPSGLDFRVEVHGTKGTVEICTNSSGLNVATHDQFRVPLLAQLQKVHRQEVGFLTGPIQHFVDCIIEDTEPMTSLNDGLIITKFISAVRESISKRNVVEIS